MNNKGLIITASDELASAKGNQETIDNLNDEYTRRAANRTIMENMFKRNCITPTSINNVTLDKLKSTIKETFQDATDSTYSYIYINCHGSTNGLWLYMDGDETGFLKFADLRDILDEIPGIKVLLIESCHSGASIATRSTLKKKINTTKDDLKAFNQSIISAFKPREKATVATRSATVKKAALRYGEFKVITACQAAESAWGYLDGNIFTKHWAKGCGWDWEKNCNQKREADDDGDNLVSLPNLVAYSKHEKVPHKEIVNNEKVTVYYDQDDACYPENDTAPVFGDKPLSTRDDAIYKYYISQGGVDSVYKYPIGPISKSPSGITYQEFEGGVIIEKKDGSAEGYSQIKLILKHVAQAHKINDGKRNVDAELFLTISIKQDGKTIVDAERWPKPSIRKHGGKEFDIIYEGTNIDIRHVLGKNVFYVSDILNAQSKIDIEIDVWDFDIHNQADKISSFKYSLNMDNGWGYGKSLTNDFKKTAFKENLHIREYNRMSTANEKIHLIFDIEKIG
jgi:hypothetical protein